MDKIDELKKMIDECNNIVVFTGAGVSTDSGIKDFRSKDGLYNIKLKYDKTAEYMLSNRCFYNEPEIFFDFYKTYMNCLDVKPNITHNYLKKLEDKGKLKAIITQNIDGLHKKAGSKNVFEIHGTIYNNHCTSCNKYYDANYIFESTKIPKCSCNSIIKPDVVLYGEMLPSYEYEQSIKHIIKADMLLVLGTSLKVYPASNLINYFNGKYLVIINNDKTSYDSDASLVINDNLKEVFNKLDKDR